LERGAPDDDSQRLIDELLSFVDERRAQLGQRHFLLEKVVEVLNRIDSNRFINLREFVRSLRLGW
jgi:hypothetical protein